MAEAAVVAVATVDPAHAEKYKDFDNLDNVDTVYIECLEKEGFLPYAMEIYWQARGDDDGQQFTATDANEMRIPRREVWKKFIPKLILVANLATTMETLVIQYHSPWDRASAFPTIPQFLQPFLYRREG